MQNKNYTKGFSVVAIIAIIAGVLVIGGGAYYYFSSHNAPVANSGIPNQETNSNPPAVNTNTNPANKTLSGNACDYFTLDIAQANFNNPVFDRKLSATGVNGICDYSNNGLGNYYPKPGAYNVAFIIVTKNYSPSDSTYDYDGSKTDSTWQDLQGIGDKAYWYYHTEKGSFTINFVKAGMLASVMLNNDGTIQEKEIKAENIAKAIIKKLP
ncbi:MAG: hypothetical protein NT155_03090 [Candidatus Staskawiczbacteria bacterium]|nr:hypothetical protein [Candidatus Staskawiczbacteria bacterium]